MSKVIYKDENGIVQKTEKGIIVKTHEGETVYEGNPGFDPIEDKWCLGTFIADILKIDFAKDGFNYIYDEEFWK